MVLRLKSELEVIVRASLYRLIVAFRFRAPALIAMMMNSLLWFLIIIVPLFFVAGETMVRYLAIAFSCYTLGSSAMWSAASDYRYYARIGVLQDLRISGVTSLRLTLTTVFFDYPLFTIEALVLYTLTHIIFGISPRIINPIAMVLSLALLLIGYMMLHALTSALFVYTTSKAPLVSIIQWTLTLGTLVPAYAMKPKEIALLNPLTIGCEWWRYSNGLPTSWSLNTLIVLTVISLVVYAVVIYSVCWIAERRLKTHGVPEY